MNQVGGDSQSRRHETLSSLQDPDRGVQAASSRSDTELLDSGARQRFAGLLCNTHSSLLHFSRREMFETSRSAEVAKSKSLSLKSQLKSPFKFLGKTYCGGCKVRADSAQPHRTEGEFHLILLSYLVDKSHIKASNGPTDFPFNWFLHKLNGFKEQSRGLHPEST